MAASATCATGTGMGKADRADMPSANELKNFGEALKSAEFRSLLADYAREVRDPDNIEKQMAELFLLERSRGVHCTFIRPQPGYVMKTRVLKSNDDNDSIGAFGKVFVNVCSDANIGKWSSDDSGLFSIPYSTSRPRRDVDKAGMQCSVYDVVFNPATLDMAERNAKFRALANSTALEGIEKAFDVTLDRKRMRFPRLKFKGSSHYTVVRRPMTAQEVSEASGESGDGSEKVRDSVTAATMPSKSFTTPKHAIKYRHSRCDLVANDEDPCRPTEIVVEVVLPGMDSAKGIDLDVLETRLTLESDRPVAYKLDLKMPYPVLEDLGSAKFDKASHTLSVTLPVKPPNKVSRLVSTDSGIGLEDDEEEEAFGGAEPEAEVDVPVPVADPDAMLPPYTCNIYEGLMVFTIGVRNVVADSLTKAPAPGGQGFRLTFSTVGEGGVAFNYGFCLVFESGEGETSGTTHDSDDIEVEVWDNNMIVQLAMPSEDSKWRSYRVGATAATLGEPTPMVNLGAVKKRCYEMKNKVEDVVKNSEEQQSDGAKADCAGKERHNSGDSVLSSSPLAGESSAAPASPTRFIVTAATADCATPRGILKRRARSYSESQVQFLAEEDLVDPLAPIPEEAGCSGSLSKKSVRFSEIVQRQVFRPNTSILGRKSKNSKKAEQKRRREAVRRASEGDASACSSLTASPPATPLKGSVDDVNDDSGVASSVEDENLVKSVSGRRVKADGDLPSAGCPPRDKSPAVDLIFDLDF